MQNNNLILIGGGGHANACLSVLEELSSYNILGYLDLKPSYLSKCGIPYLGTDELGVPKYVREACFLICIGQLDLGFKREKIFNFLTSLNAKLATIISPRAILSKTSIIGPGSIVMHGAIIQSDVKIGVNCIINDRALIEHDVIIGDHCHISTGSIINGATLISNNVFIGSGAILRNNINVGEQSLIGMGSIVLKNVMPGTKVVGNPAREFYV